MLGSILRGYSYLFQFALALVVFLIPRVAPGGDHDITLPMLPWKDDALMSWMTWLGLAGIVITALAVAGKLRFLFPLWCAFVLVMIVRGFFLGGYYYSGGQPEFHKVLIFAGAAILSLAGALTLLSRRRATA